MKACYNKHAQHREYQIGILKTEKEGVSALPSFFILLPILLRPLVHTRIVRYKKPHARFHL